MRQDVVSLAEFYATAQGRVAHKMIARRLAAIWPDAAGLDMLGAGYAAPFLEPYRKTARRVIAAMPAAQGVESWPRDAAVASTLVEEEFLPFPEALFDRALAVHLLEESDALGAVLRELWRATAAEARLVVVASSRRGLWARAERTPFGHGRSFSRRQLAKALRDALFEPVAWSYALHAPPVSWRLVVRAANAWEGVGEKLWPQLGGVVLVEAVKRLAAPIHTPARRPSFSRLRAGVPVGVPARRT